jgi:hypothetical protein
MATRIENPTDCAMQLGKQQPYCSNFVGISWITTPTVRTSRFLAGKKFHSDAEVKMTVSNWLQQEAVTFSTQAFKNL